MNIEDKIKRGDSRVLPVETENDHSVMLSCQSQNGYREFRVSEHYKGNCVCDVYSVRRSDAWTIFTKWAKEIK